MGHIQWQSGSSSSQHLTLLVGQCSASLLSSSRMPSWPARAQLQAPSEDPPSRLPLPHAVLLPCTSPGPFLHGIAHPQVRFSTAPQQQLRPTPPTLRPLSRATTASAFAPLVLSRAALPRPPCCSATLGELLEIQQQCHLCSSLLKPPPLPQQINKSRQWPGSWRAGRLPLVWERLSLFRRTRPLCPSRFIERVLSYPEMANPQGRGSSFLCLFCTAPSTMVTTTAAAKYHCGTNEVTKEAREAAPPSSPNFKRGLKESS